MGISDNTQSIIMLISGILIAIGATSIPVGAPPYASLIIMLVGAVGMALKDKLGALPTNNNPVAQPVPQPQPNNTVNVNPQDPQSFTVDQ